MRKLIIFNFFILSLICSQSVAFGQDHGHEGHDHSAHETHEQDNHSNTHDNHSEHGMESHGEESHGKSNEDHGSHGHASIVCGKKVDYEFNVGEVALHHISDANVFTIGPVHIPLPVFLYSKDQGFSFFNTKKFDVDFITGHADGHSAHKGYVLHGGTVKRIDPTYTINGQAFDASSDHKIMGYIVEEELDSKGKSKDVAYACDGENLWRLENKSTADFGLFGGGITSFYDFSPTKNVVSMIIVCLFLGLLFRSVAKAYKKRAGKEPKGVQSLMETFVVFIRDEVAIPFLGHKWEKYFTLLASIFFFILGLNLFGQIPFFGNANVTGNLAVTSVLAIIAFLVTNISGNGHYWKHLLTAPGVPFFVKVILVPVEILGIFIKPITLMLRLFANIAAGHIVLIVFVGLIFIFSQLGQNIGAGYATGIGSVLLSLFMMAIELIVAGVQAFVFTLLTASYIGAATEEAHH